MIAVIFEGTAQEDRLRVAHVLRDYGMNERSEAPEDSQIR